MSLTPGSRLGAYEIVAAIGAGGMGEVYRARDYKLNRDVALKILPASVAADSDRLARFHREAQVLAALNHPNIAAIYGFEDPSTGPGSSGPASPGQPAHPAALVLELVEGPTLADRLRAGALPVADALAIARQIADALAAAHELNIIHRDLKPANIKVRPDGTVKVLDFGLAKVLAPEGASTADAMNSPTITAGATELGLILGTAAYMAPEQARGKAVDRRADLWAFGVVLYEMLTGRRAFGGAEVSDVLAAVLKDTPSFDFLPADVPTPVRRLLRRTLEKDRVKRLDSMAAARLELDEQPDAHATDASMSSAATKAAPGGGRRAWPIAFSVLAAGLIVGGIAWYALARHAPAPLQVQRLALTAPADQPILTEAVNNDIAITPDGSRIVYLTRTGGGNAFVSRPIGSFQGELLSKLGTDPRNPFVSPDGAWIGFQTFVAGTKSSNLRRSQIDGGVSTLVTRIDGTLRGGTWVGKDSIVFATANRETGLFLVPASGGKPEPLTIPSTADNETDHLWPSALPDGKHVLFAIARRSGSDIGLLSLDTKKWRVLLEHGSSPRYVATGHIVYVSGGSLLAVPFDLGSLEIRGDPIEVQAGVMTKDSGAADFAVAENGTLVYWSGQPLATGRPLAWVDPDGKETLLGIPPEEYVDLRVSPDGRLAVAQALDRQDDSAPAPFLLLDLVRETSIRLTPPDMTVRTPIWRSDSKEIVFGAAARPTGSEPAGIFRMAVTGAAEPVRLTSAPDGQRQTPGAWTLDGRQIVFTDGPTVGNGPLDLSVLTLGMPPVVTKLVAGPGAKFGAALSPDGHWLAYTEGQDVVVRPFPNVNDSKVLVGKGSVPVWGSAGHELYLHADNTHISVALIEKTLPLTLGRPAPFLEHKQTGRFVLSLPPVNGRVLRMVGPAAAPPPAEYRVVLNWTTELAAKVKARK